MAQKQSLKNPSKKRNPKNKEEKIVKIYLIAGEPSGDLLGARVMRYLKKNMRNGTVSDMPSDAATVLPLLLKLSGHVESVPETRSSAHP